MRLRKTALLAFLVALGLTLFAPHAASADGPGPKPLPPSGSQIPGVQAAPIVYLGELVDGVTGSVPRNSISNSALWDYYYFCGQQGTTVLIDGHRTTSHMDPAMSLYFGTTTDSTGLTTGNGGPDMTFLAFADDENDIPHGVGGAFSDPRITIVLPSTGQYTLAIYDFIGAGNNPEYEIHTTGGGCDDEEDIVECDESVADDEECRPRREMCDEGAPDDEECARRFDTCDETVADDEECEREPGPPPCDDNCPPPPCDGNCPPPPCDGNCPPPPCDGNCPPPPCDDDCCDDENGANGFSVEEVDCCDDENGANDFSAEDECETDDFPLPFNLVLPEMVIPAHPGLGR